MVKVHVDGEKKKRGVKETAAILSNNSPKKGNKKQIAADFDPDNVAEKVKTPEPVLVCEFVESTHETVIPPQKVEVLNPLDPWKHIKSPYGGRMSPNDEWNKLMTFPVSMEGISMEVSRDVLVSYLYSHSPPSNLEKAAKDIFVSKERKSLSQSSLDALCCLCRKQFNNTAQSSIPPDGVTPVAPMAVYPVDKPIEKLLILNCDLVSVEVPSTLRCSLVSLDLTGNGLTTEGISTALPHLCWLRELKLSGNLLNKVPELNGLTKLLRLDISYNPLRTLHHNCIPESLRPVLREINLEGTQLRSLYVIQDDASIGGQGEKTGGNCPLWGASHLSVLNISSNNFSRLEDVSEVIQSKYFPQLKHLFLLPNPFASDSSITCFKENLIKMVMQLSCLKTINGVEHNVKLVSDPNAFVDSIERCITVNEGLSKESCSCVEGNPCAVPDKCRNWANRFEVARRVREDKYDIIF